MRGGVITKEEMLAIPAYEISDLNQIDPEPLVSVIVITYNHESYIEQAIEGILAQQCDFPIEVIIGEDKSQDRTLEICLDYQKRYQQVFRIVTWQENVGTNANFFRVWGRARGRYVSICEGDDYWIDPDKLTKQVALMEQYRDTTLCGAWVYFRNASKGDSLEALLGPLQKRDYYDLEDVIDNYIFHTSTFMFRMDEFKIPSCARGITCLDYILMAAAAIQGKIRCLPETVSVYRIHSGGIYTALKDWGKYEKDIEFCTGLSQFAGERYSRIARKKADIITYLFCSKLASKGHIDKILILTRKTIWRLALHDPRRALILIFKVYFPNTFRLVADVWISHKNR